MSKQDIKDINKFEDIVFTKRDSVDTWHASIYDKEQDRRILSIIYGHCALTGAGHRKSKYYGDKPKDDYGYEIMDMVGDNYQNYEYGPDCYVVSKRDLMRKITIARKYIFKHTTCCKCDGAGYEIERVKR